jgi:hypothetical protein
LPLLRLKINLTNGYPTLNAPAVHVEGFYKKYEAILIEKLHERWQPETLVLYDWYSFCENDMFSEVMKHRKFEETYQLEVRPEEVEKY